MQAVLEAIKHLQPGAAAIATQLTLGTFDNNGELAKEDYGVIAQIVRHLANSGVVTQQILRWGKQLQLSDTLNFDGIKSQIEKVSHSTMTVHQAEELLAALNAAKGQCQYYREIAKQGPLQVDATLEQEHESVMFATARYRCDVLCITRDSVH